MNIYYIAAIWLGMALLASFISIRIGVSVALVEILVGAVCGNIPGLPKTHPGLNPTIPSRVEQGATGWHAIPAKWGTLQAYGSPSRARAVTVLTNLSRRRSR